MKLQSVELFANSEILKNTYAYAELGSWKTSRAINPLSAAGKLKGTGYAVGVIYAF